MFHQNIVASLVGLLAAVVTLRVWTPAGGADAAERLHADRVATTDGPDLTTVGGTGSGAAPTRTVEHAPPATDTTLTPARTRCSPPRSRPPPRRPASTRTCSSPTVLWSIGLLAVLCVLVFLQSTPVLGWMLP